MVWSFGLGEGGDSVESWGCVGETKKRRGGDKSEGENRRNKGAGPMSDCRLLLIQLLLVVVVVVTR